MGHQQWLAVEPNLLFFIVGFFFRFSSESIWFWVNSLNTINLGEKKPPRFMKASQFSNSIEKKIPFVFCMQAHQLMKHNSIIWKLNGAHHIFHCTTAMYNSPMSIRSVIVVYHPRLWCGKGCVWFETTHKLQKWIRIAMHFPIGKG